MTIKWNTNQVNYLNIGLMIISAGFAFIYPFELFLLVYAVLGPLHYLTEISWLHDRNYYTQGKYDFLFLVMIGVVVTASYLLGPFFMLSCIGVSSKHNSVAFLICFAFVAALFFTLFKSPFARFSAIIPAALAAFLFTSLDVGQALFALLLPTLIHVFIFTGLFILVGVLRGKSFSGILSLVVFAAIAIGFLFVHPAHAYYHVSDYVRDSYGYLKKDGVATSPFISINYLLLQSLQLLPSGKGIDAVALVERINSFLYQNPAALALMSFISFAYTYHYFNWFSKTSIIGWDAIPRARANAILALWGASLMLYVYSYALGLSWLFFLSLSHVLLEFPLDHLTVINIGGEFIKKLKIPPPPIGL